MTMSLEQQERETDKAYAAFKTYLDLGPDRSLRQVANRLGKNHKVIIRWAHDFNWRERVRAHSARQTQLERETADSLLRAKLTDWAQRQIEQREAEWHWRTELLQVAEDIVARWRAKPERFESLASLAKILDLASKLGRLSSGLATEHQELSGPNGGAIPLEISAALDKIYGPKPAAVTEPPPIDVVGTSSAPALTRGETETTT